MGADNFYLLQGAPPNLPEGEEKKPLPASPRGRRSELIDR